jgi:hypothetical protein
LAEAKEWCKVELAIAEEDALITALITTARKQCEGFTNLSFVPKTVTAILNNSGGSCELPYGPIKDTPAVTYRDNTGTVITGVILQGDENKYIESPCVDFIKAVYETGYSTLPENFKTALLQQIVFLYENRGDVADGSQRLNNRGMPTQLSPMVSLTLKPYRRIW